jgi:ABC-type amino acid transport system permease subunit
MQLYIAAALLYFAINFALSRAGLLLERRIRYTT